MEPTTKIPPLTNDELPPFPVALAMRVGLREAVLLIKIWDAIHTSPRVEMHDGRRFVRFKPEGAEETLEVNRNAAWRTTKSLLDQGLLIARDGARWWYAINADHAALRPAAGARDNTHGGDDGQAAG